MNLFGKYSGLIAVFLLTMVFAGCEKDSDDVITAISFEEVTLPAEGYLGAEDANGFHTIDMVRFLAVYNADYGFSSGTIISALTDTVTAGYTNSYSCYAGEGAEGSTNFAVINPPFGSTDPIINFDNAVKIKSIEIANTTYAGLSMKLGDAFGKAFSAEDEDFFSVTFEGFDDAGNSTGEVLAYLADFRAGSNTGILKTWNTVELESLGAVSSIGVTFNSSDIGTYGINTPMYVAIDDIRFVE